MKRNFFVLAISFQLSAISLMLLAPASCFAQSVSSVELIEKAKEYNNQIVEYEGEVVGDVMGRGNFAWVNVNDGKNAIGVFGKKELINNVIQHKGSYNCKGDIIRVRGVFCRACPQHGGDLDIHLKEVVKVKNGYFIVHHASGSKAITAIGLSIVALGFAALVFFKTGRK
jgi:hypothetical protein